MKETVERFEKTDEAWQNELTPEQYRICRLKGTEAPFSGQYNDCKTSGTYTCTCCGNALFHSAKKFDSGSGWPSFWQAVSDEVVRLESDHSHGMVRVEALCSRCDAHLGHVFPDGPPPTYQRFCINSTSLKLKPD
jgi:peptide-methionine (R)-S-oxide reductase